MFGGGAMARAEFVRVVCVDAVGDNGEPAGASERFEFLEEFILAVVAAVGVIGDVEGIRELIGADAFVANAGGSGEAPGFAEVVFGKACGESSDGKSAITESFMRGPGKISRVRSAGKRDEQRAKWAQRGE